MKTFTLEGAFDEGLVGLVCDGKFATSAQFIAAINSGEKVVVNAHDQSRRVIFDDEAPKYKIVNDKALIAIKTERGHDYPVSVFVYDTSTTFITEYDGRVDNGMWNSYQNLPVGKEAMFSDIKDSDFKEDIEKAVQRGIMNGYTDGTFKPNEPYNGKPNEPITRAMMCAFLNRLYDIF